LTFNMKRKLGFLMVGASALALAACGGGGDTADSADDTPSVMEQAGDAASGAADAAGDAADATAAAASDAADAAGEAAVDMADMASDAANDAAETASNAASEAMDSAEGAMDDAAGAAADAMDDAQDAADEATEAATDAAEGAATDIAAAAGVAADKVTAETVSAYEALTGDPDAGRRVFTKCMSCHVVAEGQNRVGPSLYGIVGRQAGSIEGFRYSDANANSGITWTEPVMFAYLEKPQEFIRGTSMAFPGLPVAQDRADVIAYIKRESGQ
jgi:cytochrome c